MGKNTSFAVGEHFAEFIHEQVESGRYASASEVVRAGLRLLQVEEEKIRALREAIDHGLASGRVEPFDFDEFLERKNREFRSGE
jgi:antitoxin ParD1/3/4